ncbi:MAG: nucleotidyltransferase domain-containing protein [Sandaracinaceae bacterium]|nr:nucleotidyltransferase domain-containing protein [Sandaracinaceae bacterium]
MPLIPDMELARRFLAAHPPPGALLHVGLVGAHDYGFPSPDSDLDLKGMHLAPTTSLLGLTPISDTHDVLTELEGVELDLTTHEAGKALALLLRGNGNVLERLMAPVQAYATDALDELRALATGALSKRFAQHYRGYFGGMVREHEREPRAKSALYACRVALTGIHLLGAAECRTDVTSNAAEYGLDVTELIAIKRAGPEKGPLPAALDGELRASWPRLDGMLADALERTSLPDEPPNAAAIEAWLVAARLAALDR